MRLPVLEIGTGNVRDPDVDLYNDIQPLPGIHLVCDARHIAELPNGSCSIIYSNHLIEHLDEQGQMELLQEAYRLLADGGMLLMWTPDAEWMNEALRQGHITPEWYQTLLHGQGDGPYDRHKHLLTQEMIKDMLLRAGFRVHTVREVGGSIECIAFKEKRASTTPRFSGESPAPICYD